MKDMVKRAGNISVSGNIILFAAKLVAGIATGSLAIVADAWHTLSDSISSVILLVGNKKAKKPADHEHPFGHGRAELVSSVMIGTILGMVAIDFTMEAIKKLFSPHAPRYSITAIAIIAVSILAKELMAQYAFYAARKTGSAAVKADGWHHRSDALSSLILLAGIILAGSIPYADSILALIISALIALTAYHILRDAISPLIGESPERETEKNIQDIVDKHQDSKEKIHHLHIHRYGDHTEATFHIVLDGKTSLENAHKTASDIEKDIRKELNIEATIHVEPFDDWQDEK
ncbi:cation diffusion facilitator family transporter [Spirochaetia bacterium 38H-sp]|uniref:Cation diffusion facilitator family transporter n=1 Tax=Rarispira pelagica TaxID=3141764 RepID=A0ABU9U8T7_9SPIR